MMEDKTQQSGGSWSSKKNSVRKAELSQPTPTHCWGIYLGGGEVGGTSQDTERKKVREGGVLTRGKG
jgi:hypothetical protein